MYALKQQLDYNEKTLWDDCLITLRHECGESAYNSWLTHLRFVGIRDDIIILAAPSKLIREWVLTHYFVKIKEVLSLIEPQLHRWNVTGWIDRARKLRPSIHLSVKTSFQKLTL